MKKVFKVMLKVIIYLLILTTLITSFIIVSRNNNQAKINEELLAYKSHPKLNEMDKLSPENIGFQKKKIIEGSLRGFHYIPNDIRHKGVIVTFGGSDGGSFEYISNYLSSDGYEVIAVTYFGEKGQPEQGESVQLEIYEDIYTYIKENCNNGEIITLFGASKGAQLTLLLSTYYDSIDNVVLMAPTSYALGIKKLGKETTANWTYDGKDIEYLNGKRGIIPIIRSLTNLLLNKPHDQLIFVNSEFKNSTNLEESRIKVENTNAKILIFYGGDDRMLDAKSSSSIIKENAKNEIIIYGYENAGHVFASASAIKIDGVVRLNGGDLDANIEADLDSKRVLLETLELWHK